MYTYIYVTGIYISLRVECIIVTGLLSYCITVCAIFTSLLGRPHQWGSNCIPYCITLCALFAGVLGSLHLLRSHCYLSVTLCVFYLQVYWVGPISGGLIAYLSVTLCVLYLQVYWVGPISGSVIATLVYHFGLDTVGRHDKRTEKTQGWY